MNRWLVKSVRKVLAGGLTLLLGLGLLSGCQPIFMSRDVYEQAHSPSLMPKKLEQDHAPITGPIGERVDTPATVSHAERPPYYLTLQEAIAHALENGHVSTRGGIGRGLVDDNMVNFTGPSSTNSQSERLRVLALNPAISFAAMEGSISRYDAIYNSNIIWQGTDNVQTGSFSSTNGNFSTLTSTIAKPLPSGGIVSASLIGSYQYLNAPPFGAFAVLNPQYTVKGSIGIEQPLWRDWGEINQLLSRFPSPSGQSLPGQGFLANQAISTRQGNISSFVDRSTEGILISRLRFDQSRAEFERNVQHLVMNVEVGYWTLYNSYGQLWSVEEAAKEMHKAWQEAFNRWKAGNMDPDKYYRVLGQYQEFRGERIRALQEVLEAERNLRGLIGKPAEDGTRLVPISPPTMTEHKPDWTDALEQALTSRPELQIARDNLRFHQYLLTIQNNSLKPDVRFFARYEPVGFGSNLLGSGTFVDGNSTTRTSSALSSLRQLDFADYQMGINMTVPLGYRFEAAAVRAARLELAQAYHLVRDQEQRATRALQQQFQEIDHWYSRIGAHKSERLAYFESRETIKFQIKGGRKTPGDLEYLESVRRWSAAQIKEFKAIAEYNSALARFEWAKGAAMTYNNIRISEGPLPEAAQVRAVDHQKERARALVLRERPDSLYHPGRMAGMHDGDLPNPEAPGVIETKPSSVPQPEMKPADKPPAKLPDKLSAMPKPLPSFYPASTRVQQVEKAPVELKPAVRTPDIFKRMPEGNKTEPPMPQLITPSEPAPTPGPLLIPTTSVDDPTAPRFTNRSGFVTIENEPIPRVGLGMPREPEGAIQPIQYRPAPR